MSELGQLKLSMPMISNPSRVSCQHSVNKLPTNLRNFLKNLPERFGNSPVRVVGLHLAQVAVIANVISETVLVDIATPHFSARDLFDDHKGLKNGTGIR